MFAQLKFNSGKVATLGDDGKWTCENALDERVLNLLYSPLRQIKFVSRATPDWALEPAKRAAKALNAMLLVPDNGVYQKDVIY